MNKKITKKDLLIATDTKRKLKEFVEGGHGSVGHLEVLVKIEKVRQMFAKSDYDPDYLGEVDWKSDELLHKITGFIRVRKLDLRVLRRMTKFRFGDWINRGRAKFRKQDAKKDLKKVADCGINTSRNLRVLDNMTFDPRNNIKFREVKKETEHKGIGTTALERVEELAGRIGMDYMIGKTTKNMMRKTLIKCGFECEGNLDTAKYWWKEL